VTKKELVKYVSDRTLITERDASIICDVVFDGIKDALENGQNVKVRGLGSFYIHNRKPRKSVSPKDQTPIMIPAKKVVKFKVSKKLNERIN
jgi:nucleoid DNA-binding protein